MKINNLTLREDPEPRWDVVAPNGRVISSSKTQEEAMEFAHYTLDYLSDIGKQRWYSRRNTA